jgi:hypothetical protein
MLPSSVGVFDSMPGISRTMTYRLRTAVYE